MLVGFDAVLKRQSGCLCQRDARRNANAYDNKIRLYSAAVGECRA